ncbi:MAG: DNA double-strand break repair nuclease NurA, partial [Treponema sp.]|nr:DNA double-strand break repair nuclease NurA [Treponema sp.]
LEGHPEKGFPGAEYGYVTIAAVLIDLKLISQLEKEDIIDPKLFRKTETPATQESCFPGCNIILDNDKDAKSSLRKALYEDFKNSRALNGGETILETYEHLLKLKIDHFPDAKKPDSPIDDIEKEMIYGFGEYVCPDSGEPLYSTDALRLHELMNPSGTNGELFGQIMSTLEKLWLINFLRYCEQKDFLSTLRRISFIIDGPLAVFSTSSWLTKVIEAEIIRINEKQKVINGHDMMIIGIEKSGMFFNHFRDIDTSKEGNPDIFPNQSALLLTDDYIKENIIFSQSTKPYGQDTYFGRKFFYKAASGQRIVPVVAWYNKFQKDIKTAEPEKFSRLSDVMSLLDKVVSNRYPNSLSPLISAHAEAAIPLNMGTKLFEKIARELREKSENG